MVDESSDQLPASPLRGRLLVANPLMLDSNFDRSVVLVLAHGPDGALGVILNRPGEAAVAEVLPRWADVVAPPDVLFGGGPVNLRAVIGLARRHDNPAERQLPDGELPVDQLPDDRESWTAVAEDIGTVDLELDPSELTDDLVALRVFVGYAGWSAGQLEAEIAGDGWWVVDALPEDAFVARPESLWRDVLRRQPGPLALVAAYPPDPEMN